MPSDAPAPDLAGPPPGWRVGACLSRRNGTHVHRAEHLDGRVALLKRLDRAAPDPLTRLRFQREARLARLLAHPGLAALLGNLALAGADPDILALTNAIAAGAILAMIVDTMIPEAFEETHEFAGLITVAGFLAAFALSKLGG